MGGQEQSGRLDEVIPDVWYVSAEATPYVKVGGLGDVAGELPLYLSGLGVETTLCLPLHQGMTVPGGMTARPIRDLPAWVGPAHVYLSDRSGTKARFYSLPRWFNRDRVYGYGDDGERFAAFCLAVACDAVACGSPPNLLHLQDWHAAPLAMLVQAARERPSSVPFRRLGDMRTLLTIHSLQYQGWHHASFCYLFDMGFSMDRISPLFREGFNALKAGIVWADALNTVSPTYAREICRPNGGFGLETVLRQRADTLPEGMFTGILNRLDTSWDPQVDEALPYRFSDRQLQFRGQNRLSLEDEMGFSHSGEPLVAFVGRLAEGKGIELLAACMPAWLGKGMRLIVLGMGESRQEALLARLVEQWPSRVVWRNAYLPALARRMYGGADMLLMPSEREACGLSQQMAMRYGCVPVARKTGGLADTIVDGVTGFLYARQSGTAFHRAMTRAVEAFTDETKWKSLVKQAMRMEAGWAPSAQAYVSLYRRILSAQCAGGRDPAGNLGGSP